MAGPHLPQLANKERRPSPVFLLPREEREEGRKVGLKSH